MHRYAAFPLLLAACTNPQTITGQVIDVWGRPVPGATVVVEGQASRPETDERGYFTVPRAQGTLKIKAGRQGYIQAHEQVEVPAEGDAPRPILRLYPKPEENGFYVIGTDGYVEVDEQPVHVIGNEVQQITGIRSMGKARAQDPLRVVLHTDLSRDQLAQLDLELHRLAFLEDTPLPGPLGLRPVPVALYTSKGDVDIDIEALRSATDYLITSEGLEPGYYAFSMMGLLDPRDSESFARIPAALRVAFPVEIR